MFIIGIVNYKTSDLIETQLKIYRDFANSNYQLILLDTSRDNKEYDRLCEIRKLFNISIEIMQYNPSRIDGSGAHGESLQYLYRLCNKKAGAKFFLVQDPDFFWVKPSFLGYLKQLLEQYDAVGAPYSVKKMKTIGGERSDFPAAFGAVYKIDVLQSIEANFQAATINTNVKDVGWQIRENFGTRPYRSFQQTELSLVQTIGLVSRENLSCTYLDNNEIIAHHLYRCSMSNNPYSGSFKHPDRAQWQKNRKLMCDKIWEEIKFKAAQ